ncbi:uncharacterized protein LOC143363941 [Halictus rubicundus]|uniref:uncharacterized protein LOC143363941 n=1 Tax=Halictus rubicundus TaxID=77578 RepID=UPI004036F647
MAAETPPPSPYRRSVQSRYLKTFQAPSTIISHLVIPQPLIFAFAQKPEKHTPRQFRWLDLIGQFSTDIRHVSGKDNVIADALSRIAEISSTVDYVKLAESQQQDEELRMFLQSDSSLVLKRVALPGTSTELYCDTATRIRHLRTTAYHPQANGMVQRFHRQLKAEIVCHANTDWVNALPIVLLGIRTAWKEDIKATSAEMLYATHVFVRHGGCKRALQPAYDGPFCVVERHPKHFNIRVKDRVVPVSLDRLKPAYLLRDDEQDNTDPQPRSAPTAPVEPDRITRSGRRSKYSPSHQC